MDIAEKRVYEEQAGRTRLAVATGAGLAVVGISGDTIGEFGLAAREPALDVAPLGDDELLVATPDDAPRVALGEDGVAETDAVVETGAGPTDAVAAFADTVIAAGADGTLRRAPIDDLAEAADASAWTEIAELDARAADGRYVAAADGIRRVTEDGVEDLGLEDARDVAAAGPFAATADGCYAPAGGGEHDGPGHDSTEHDDTDDWTRELDASVDVVAASPRDARAHAASGADLYQREPAADGPTSATEAATTTWTAVEWPPAAGVADLAYADATYAVAEDGTVLADAGDGWRTRSIGLPDVRACCVVR